jgi:hypothetical protein
MALGAQRTRPRTRPVRSQARSILIHAAHLQARD